ncbi:heavy metal translocating P-type ATPase [Bosea sp. BE125]|uniref:heavy metal translocating P-type ATPase n=1 Tax=Bosea sp. BE125 TaxID=2817909 RepID=UPI0028600842|nr:heavy metal translocating P-type ATPase [Bosea sp. BE125]MDR6870379.1 heavy metal translocating P-type ATPase [Bosea sp. BE125]
MAFIPTVKRSIVACPLAGLLIGFCLHQFGEDELARSAWAWATLPVLAVLCVEIVIALRRGEFGLDIVAALSMSAALVFGEPLAAIVVALMYAGGQHLEDFAERRARSDMTALLDRAPRSVMRYENGQLCTVATELVLPGDALLIRSGDIIPVDGRVAHGTAVLDMSALTGEALPQRMGEGAVIASGALNRGDAFDLTALRLARDSVYAGIVRLVDAAQKSKAPMARLADRYALAFLVVTLVMAGGAWWLSGDASRAVAVLVVATPCPLLLAVPIALVAGMSRAAKAGILIKSGAALEKLALLRAIVFDKTGTLTSGSAEVVEITPAAGFSANELLRVAASLGQISNHIVSHQLVSEARQRGIELVIPTDVSEAAGEGVTGFVGGKRMIIGKFGFVLKQLRLEQVGGEEPSGLLQIAVAIGQRYAGRIVMSDRLRHGTPDLLHALRENGIVRLILATGDHRAVAETLAAGLDLDAIEADLTPAQKTGVVAAAQRYGPVMMVGDGVNDSPALAAADVGVAMGLSGSAASIETADVVLLVDRLDRLVTALQIAKRSRAIAIQSVVVGIGLSTLGMIAAAFGGLSPVEGALLQEAIDVAVILNALRALGDRHVLGRPLRPQTDDVG